MEVFQIVGVHQTGNFWVDDLVYKNHKKAEARLNVLLEEEKILLCGCINKLYVL